MAKKKTDVNEEKDLKKVKNTKTGKNKEKSKKNNKKKNEKYNTTLKKELKLVKWPAAKDILKYTIATIALCIVLALFFELLNIIMAYVKGLFN